MNYIHNNSINDNKEYGMNQYMWAILTACVWGIVPLLEKAGLAKVSPFVGLFYRSLGVVLGLLIMGIFLVKPQQLKAVDGRSIMLLVLGGFLASFIAQICFYHGLKIGEISRVVPISGMYPLVAFLLGVLIFGESFNLVKMAGVGLIIAGVWALKIG